MYPTKKDAVQAFLASSLPAGTHFYINLFREHAGTPDAIDAGSLHRSLADAKEEAGFNQHLATQRSTYLGTLTTDIGKPDSVCQQISQFVDDVGSAIDELETHGKEIPGTAQAAIDECEEWKNVGWDFSPRREWGTY